MLRILHLPKWYPHRYDDQDGDFVARHVAAIAAHGGREGNPTQSAVVFATVARGPLPTLIAEDVDLSGPIPTWRYYYRARPTGLAPLDKLLKLGLWLLCQWRGQRAVRQHWAGARPDVVHAHVLVRPAALAWVLRLRHGTPYVLTEHQTALLPANAARLGWLRRWLVSWLVRGAAASLPVSADLGRALAALGGANAHTVVIPNVVDTELFHLPPAGQRRFGLLNVAAFNEQAKNLSGLLRAVAQLRATYPALPGLHLRIAGYGPAEKAMHHLAQELGLLADGTVEFLGKLPPAQVAAEMRQATAFVLFSNYENLPCVLIEAQASGLPAVATRVGGVPELLPAASLGLLVPAGDEAALRQALLEVLTAPTGRFEAAQLRARAVALYQLPGSRASVRGGICPYFGAMKIFRSLLEVAVVLVLALGLLRGALHLFSRKTTVFRSSPTRQLALLSWPVLAVVAGLVAAGPGLLAATATERWLAWGLLLAVLALAAPALVLHLRYYTLNAATTLVFDPGQGRLQVALDEVLAYDLAYQGWPGPWSGAAAVGPACFGGATSTCGYRCHKAILS